MGSFYSNVVVFGAAEAAVIGACRAPAFVAGADEIVTVFEKGDDDGSDPINGRLSAALGCVTLHVSVHDSELFSYSVYVRGDLVASGVIPDPAQYFGEEFGFHPKIEPADPARLVAALGRGDVDDVAAAFEHDFVFAEERHGAMLVALGLPTTSSGLGYHYLRKGDVEYQGPPLRHVDD
ncbi:MAG: hypothetical protein ABIQ73_09715 [Acidimicrobiales bacterium]